MASQAPTRRQSQASETEHAASEEHDGEIDFRDGDLDTIARTIKEGWVNNPFRRWNPKVVPKVSRAFARICNLKDKTALFEISGEILRDPNSWKDSVGQQLSKEDWEALEHERDGFWAQPKMLKVTIVLLCLGAVVQGWTQSISNVANLGWPTQLGLPSLEADSDDADQIETWKFGLVNASTYLAASMIGCWLSDPLSELFWGRRPPVMISSIFILAATIGSACVPGIAPDETPHASGQWKLLLACRVLMGIGMGCKATVITVYAAEVSPSHLRGTLVVNWQLFTALGIFFGFAANVGISQVDHIGWRLQTATLCIPTTLVLVLVWICPDSPRYQMKRSSQLQHNKLEEIWVGRRGIKTWFVFMCWVIQWLLRICVCDFPKEGDTPPAMPIQQAGKVTPMAANLNDHDGETAEHIEDDRPIEQPAGTPSADDSGDHDYRKAFHTLVELRGSQILAAKELLYVHVQMVVETQVTSPERLYRVQKRAAAEADGQSKMDMWLKTPKLDKVRYVEKIRHLWTKDRIRRATGNAVVCMLSQQLSGVNVLAFYSSTLFSSTVNSGPCDGKGDGEGGSTLDSPNDLLPLWLSCGIGAINFVFGIPAYWLIENVGRRSLLLITSPFLTVFTLGACLSYLMDPCQQPQAEAVGAFTFLFMVAYSFGMGPVPFTMSSEVFPLEHRMVGMSLAVFCNLFGAGVLALVVPPIIQTDLGNQGLLAIFVGLNILSFFLILFFVRETAGTADEDSDEGTKAKTLEELTYTFSKPTKEFIAYQWNDLRPYALKVVAWPFRWIWSIIMGGDKPPWPKKPKMKPTKTDTEMHGIAATTGGHADATNGHPT